MRYTSIRKAVYCGITVIVFCAIYWFYSSSMEKVFDSKDVPVASSVHPSSLSVHVSPSSMEKVFDSKDVLVASSVHPSSSSLVYPSSSSVHVSSSSMEKVFGSKDVLVASSVHLSSWLSLSSQLCNDHKERILIFRYIQVKLACKKIHEPCYIWHWDVANWTLTYTNKIFMVNSLNPTMFCPIPIHGERTAKIIRPNGRVDYPGCTIQKPQCASMPLFYAFFDNDLNQRINRSPCCRKLLLDVTHHMGRVFDKRNITYFLVGGPVISLVRDSGQLIPYDTDTDVAVDANDVNKVEEAIPELQKPGYVFKWKTEYSKGLKRYMVGCSNKNCLTGPGIAFYSVEGDMISAPVIGWPALPTNITLPPIRRKFEGVEMGFPKEPEKYLDYNYGRDKWRTSLNCTKHRYGQCSS